VAAKTEQKAKGKSFWTRVREILTAVQKVIPYVLLVGRSGKKS